MNLRMCKTILNFEVFIKIKHGQKVKVFVMINIKYKMKNCVVCTKV